MHDPLPLGGRVRLVGGVQERGGELDRQQAREDQADDGQEDADTCVHEDHSLLWTGGSRKERSKQYRRTCSYDVYSYAFYGKARPSTGPPMCCRRRTRRRRRPAVA